MEMGLRAESRTSLPIIGGVVYDLDQDRIKRY